MSDTNTVIAGTTPCRAPDRLITKLTVLTASSKSMPTSARKAAFLRLMDRVCRSETEYATPPGRIDQNRASTLLRDSHEAAVLTTAGRRAGVHGMGGIGKSVLAAAVGRDLEVRRAFPDGLVWAALGPKPNLPLRLTELCRAFGGPGQKLWRS